MYTRHIKESIIENIKHNLTVLERKYMETVGSNPDNITFTSMIAQQEFHSAKSGNNHYKDSTIHEYFKSGLEKKFDLEFIVELCNILELSISDFLYERLESPLSFEIPQSSRYFKYTKKTSETDFKLIYINEENELEKAVVRISDNLDTKGLPVSIGFANPSNLYTGHLNVKSNNSISKMSLVDSNSNPLDILIYDPMIENQEILCFIGFFMNCPDSNGKVTIKKAVFFSSEYTYEESHKEYLKSILKMTTGAVSIDSNEFAKIYIKIMNNPNISNDVKSMFIRDDKEYYSISLDDLTHLIPNYPLDKDEFCKTLFNILYYSNCPGVIKIDETENNLLYKHFWSSHS